MMAKKMVLVDPRMLESIQQQQQQQQQPPLLDPQVESLKKLDRGIQNIINDDDGDDDGGDDFNKALVLNQLLLRFLKRVRQHTTRPLGTVTMEQPPEQPKEGRTDTVMREVMNSVPVTFKKKAESLLRRVKENPELSWNERGEVTFKGREIPRSNLVDLINDVLRKRQTVGKPEGWETFAAALKGMNVPRELVGNAERWEYIQQYPGRRNREEEEEEEEVPKKKKQQQKKRKKEKKQQQTGERFRWEESPL